MRIVSLAALLGLAAAFSPAHNRPNPFQGVGSKPLPQRRFDTGLLAAGSVLAAGANGMLTLTVRVDSGGEQGPFTNVVTATGSSPATQVVTDSHDETVFDLPLSVIEIPTLGEWGLIALMSLLALAALWRLRPARA